MKSETIYPGGYDDIAIETATNTNPMPRHFSLRAKLTANAMVEQGMLDSGQDKLAAQLARTSMQNIGSLSMTAEQLSCMGPNVNACCQAIMATYLKGALTRLERW